MKKFANCVTMKLLKNATTEFSALLQLFYNYAFNIHIITKVLAHINDISKIRQCIISFYSK